MKKIHFGFVLLFVLSCADQSDPSVRFFTHSGEPVSSDTTNILTDSTSSSPVKVLEIHSSDDKKIKSVEGYVELNGGNKTEMGISELAVFFDNYGNGKAKHAVFLTTNKEVADERDIPLYKAQDLLRISVEVLDGDGNTGRYAHVLAIQ